MMSFGYEAAIAGELAAGAVDREAADRLVAERWRREDEWRLREKIKRWNFLADARRKVR